MFDERIFAAGDHDAIDGMVGELVWGAADVPLALLHRLLADGRHRQHQQVVRRIQDAAQPTSVSHLRAALAAGFDRFEYTASEGGVIAKWFSHALAAIGTEEATAVLREFAAAPDPEIRAEMRYRLRAMHRADSGR